MGDVVWIHDFAAGRGMRHLLTARGARDTLDTATQLAEAEAACRMFERQQNDRGIAGLLEATSLVVDAYGAIGEHLAALQRAAATEQLLHEVGAPSLALRVADRHVRRSREVSGDADAVMRESMASYFGLRQAQGDRRQRDVEALSALTSVLSCAHRSGTADALRFASTAIKHADRLLEAVRAYDQRAAARHDMWAGLYLSGIDESPAHATSHLRRYLVWTDGSLTPRNEALRQFAHAEVILCAGNRRAARDAFQLALANIDGILTRKHRAARSILARRSLA